MKNKPNAPGVKRKTTFRLSGEKIVIGLFASLSLAFALFYTFAQNTTHAESPEIVAASPEESSPKVISAVIPSDTNAQASVSDVVNKALAFKASLTTAQQATLEQAYTPALARRWSNLPCGTSCRNGIQFSTLTSAQLALALQVIQAASGTAANEGYDEFNQIRAADAYLNANGGGSGYGSGIYFLAFLNTPSTNGGWMLQYGGHHYAANISFNQGHFVATTPMFYGSEPTTFTLNGNTYAPLEQERGALQNMLAALSTAQLTTARLTQTFGDVTMSPGESNGGNGTFPATRVGLAVSTLSDAQKLLVLEAIKPYVKDVDDTVAANLLQIYQNELNNTYIAYTGNGTSGTPSSFLNANTNYVRIDGTSVWIEFICQNGAVFRNIIHYHTVWRDRQRDYGADLSLTTPLDIPSTTAANSPYDFDGDGKSDISIYRPSSGEWWVNRSSTSATSVAQFGTSTDQIVPADFSGDGLTDIAVWRPASGEWFILRSEDNSFYSVPFGTSGDVPAPADYDGDDQADVAIYRPADFTWYIQKSTGGTAIVTFGTTNDVPVAGDYDGDGLSDIAIYRPSAGEWWILKSSTSTSLAYQFGTSTDIPVQGDWTGDGKTDSAIWRPSTGEWFILRSEDSSFYSVPYGISTDTPAPGDYDGDGKFDTAVFRSGTWYINRSTAGSLITTFGLSTDTPVESAYLP